MLHRVDVLATLSWHRLCVIEVLIDTDISGTGHRWLLDLIVKKEEGISDRCSVRNLLRRKWPERHTWLLQFAAWNNFSWSHPKIFRTCQYIVNQWWDRDICPGWITLLASVTIDKVVNNNEVSVPDHEPVSFCRKCCVPISTSPDSNR